MSRAVPLLAVKHQHMDLLFTSFLVIRHETFKMLTVKNILRLILTRQLFVSSVKENDIA